MAALLTPRRSPGRPGPGEELRPALVRPADRWQHPGAGRRELQPAGVQQPGGDSPCRHRFRVREWLVHHDSARVPGGVPVAVPPAVPRRPRLPANEIGRLGSQFTTARLTETGGNRRCDRIAWCYICEMWRHLWGRHHFRSRWSMVCLGGVGVGGFPPVMSSCASNRGRSVRGAEKSSDTRCAAPLRHPTPHGAPSHCYVSCLPLTRSRTALPAFCEIGGRVSRHFVVPTIS